MEKSLILLVDDNPKDLEVLGGLLEAAYKTAVVENGADALKFARKRHPDLILLDIVMPEMDGFEVCRQLKASPDTQDIPVIFLTAKTKTDDVIEGFDAGAVDYITKPFEKREIMARISTHLKLHALEKELKEHNRQLQQEIAERKAAERALQESEEKYIDFLNMLPQVVFEIDRSFHITYFNDFALKMFNLTQEDLARRKLSVTDIMHGEDLQRLYQSTAQNFSGLKHEGNEYLITADHQQRYFRIYNTHVYKDGEIIALRGVAFDITKSKHAEQALKESEATLRTVLNNAQVGISLTRLDGTILNYNPVILDIYGIPENSSTEDYNAAQFYADERDRQRFIHALKQHGRVNNFETTLRKVSGERIYATINANFIELKGEPLILAALLDVTQKKLTEQALKESQERFELAMQATSDGLWDWNLLTNDIYYSPNWKRMLGYNEEELDDKFSVWETLVHPDDLQKSWDMLNRHLQGQAGRFDLEFKMKHKDGHWVDILSRAHAFFDENGQAYRVVGTHVSTCPKVFGCSLFS